MVILEIIMKNEKFVHIFESKQVKVLYTVPLQICSQDIVCFGRHPRLFHLLFVFPFHKMWMD